MSARRKEINVQLNQLLDAVMLGGILWGCHALRYYGIFIVDALYEIPPFSAFYWMLAILMPFGPFLLEIQGFYNHPLDKSVVKSVTQIFRAGLWLVLLLGAASFFLRLDIPSRSVLILFAIFSPLALLAKDRLLALRYYRKLQRGAGGEPVIFAGEPDKMRVLIGGFTATQRLEVRVVERVDLVSGGVDDLVSAIHRHSVGRVILAFSRIELEKVQKAIEACELEGVEAWLNADFIRTSVARPAYETFGRSAMLVFRATPEISWAMMLKNLMDRVGAACILMAVSPILIAAAVAVRLSSKGPIIFRQQRAGLHGKPFTMFKFRTMCADAEKRKAEIEGLNTMSGPVFKVDNDPRVTRAGHFLRRTSIDELPQLINVFLGDMSLVGPRPLPLYEVEKFEYAAHRRRLSMKPGLTCLWQVRGRNSVTSFDDWVKMDLEYIDNWSLTLDIVILLRTVPVVLFGWGAK